MMDIVQAGEEILRGEPYVTCHTCGGRGERQVYEGSTPRLTECNGCFGQGNVPRPAYFQACQVLGRPMPTERPKPIGTRRSR